MPAFGAPTIKKSTFILKESFINYAKNQNYELIVVTGSLFVAAEFRELLLEIEPEIYETNEL